ncbi:MAG: aminopeptidase [Clostridia bacterium]
MNKNLLNKYARILVENGVNLKKKQTLVISAPIQSAELVREISKVAYQVGAKDVAIFWRDALSSKIRFTYGKDSLFDMIPSWQKEFFLSYVKEGAAFISITGTDPSIMKGVDPKRMQKYSKTYNEELSEYREKTMSNELSWCVAAAATNGWAKKVYPNLEENLAVEKLWKDIFKATRTNLDDPVKAWDEHTERMRNKIKILNEYQFDLLQFKANNGTNFTVELPSDHIWTGGSEETKDGRKFIANIPTEEIFTSPKKYGINGKVVSSMPLSFNGNLIEDFEFEVKNGKIVKFSAKEGYEQLKELINTDEGSAYFGEVALVEDNSPISNMNTIFFNTLFDENASCHLAIGQAYPMTIKNGQNMDKSQLKKRGLNDSLVHVDFMIGTKDLAVYGKMKNSEIIPIFQNGNFAI